MAITNTMVLLDKESDVRCFIKFKAALRQSFLPPPLILLLQLKVMNIKTPAVGLGTIRIGLGTLRIEKDGMNLTGVILIGKNPPTIVGIEEDPDPGEADPPLVHDAAATTRAQTGQVQP